LFCVKSRLSGADKLAGIPHPRGLRARVNESSRLNFELEPVVMAWPEQRRDSGARIGRASARGTGTAVGAVFIFQWPLDQFIQNSSLVAA
jgi:hypothetical protein